MGYLSDIARRRIAALLLIAGIALAARLLEEAGRLSCQEILAVAKESFVGIKVRIREVSVSGLRARVEADVKQPGTPGAESKTIFLDLDEAGEWRVSDPG